MKQYKVKYFLSIFVFLSILLSPLSAMVLPLTISASASCKNLDDESTNNTKPGKTVSDLDGKTEDTRTCFYGESEHSDIDYYSFTIGAEGNLTVTTSSPNNHLYHMAIEINGHEWFPDTKVKNTTLLIPLQPNDSVVFYLKETGDDLDEYQLDLEFKEGSTKGVLVSGNRPFTVRNPIETRNIAGNYAIIGNSNLCAIDSENSNAPWQGECINSFSNRKAARYVDIDNDPTTKNSSTSTLNITADFSPSGGAKVVWAGLYWQGVVHNSLENGDFMGTAGNNDGATISNEPQYGTYEVQLNFTQSSSLYDANKIKFKLPGSNSYIDITADVFDFYKLGYSGFKDVTALIQNLPNPNGIYGVADIKTHQGVERAHGNFGAWGLVVIYEDPHESFRNITLFDGYVTVDSHYDEDLVMNGFLTPRKTPINSKLAMFAMDGDNGDNGMKIENQAGEVTYVENQDNPNNSLFDSTISSSIERNPSATSLRTDLKVLDLVDVLNPLETEATLKPRSGGDRYTPSFFIMSAELIRPNLCYDYAYQQNNRYFTEENNGSFDPHIKGTLFNDSNITVSVYIRNQEDSDFTIENLTTSVMAIDTTQATYIPNTTQVILPGEMQRHSVNPQSFSDDHISQIPIGTIEGKESFYFYYALDPKQRDIDIPMNIYLDYNATFTLPNGSEVTLPPYHQEVNSDIPLCVDGNFSYAPIYGIFNVEQKALNAYNIYTQVVHRVDNFEIKAYDATNLSQPVSVSTAVAVEIIDAGAYHETQTSCQEPDSALTPRVWMIFDGNVSSVNFTRADLEAAIQDGMVKPDNYPLSSPEAFYGTARQNAAFRLSTGRKDSNGSIYQLENNQGSYSINNLDVAADLGNGAGNCANDATQSIANACPSGMSKSQVATCMECLYDYNLLYICSRDNFAIRPEAFSVSLSDDNTSITITNFANNTDKAGTPSNPIHLVAGYPYRFDINATTYTGQQGVIGYTQRFNSALSDRSATMKWNPRTITIAQAQTNCNVPNDQNMSFSIISGSSTKAWDNDSKHDALIDVGEYQFIISDKEWSKYDWDPKLTQHHAKNGFLSQNNDCLTSNDTSVATVPDVQSNPNTPSQRSGCLISSIHARAPYNYQPVYIRSHPYKLDLSAILHGARPQNVTADSFVYINTLDLQPFSGTKVASSTDENMSFNIQGTIQAVGYTNQPTKNFVNGCYAEDLSMKLNYTYLNSSAPTDPTTILHYDLYNQGVPNFTRVTEEVPSDNQLDQDKSNFIQTKEGSLTMDLGYNFYRTYDQAVNPILMKMNDFNVSYKNQPNGIVVEGNSNYKIESILSLDQNVTFIYGMAHPNMFLYDNILSSSVKTPVSIVAYCDLGVNQCQERGLDTIASGMLDDAKANFPNWWFVENHDATVGDGEVKLEASSTGSVTSTVMPISGIDNSVTVTNTSGSTPNLVNINFADGTARWLIFNKGNNSIPQPFYQVRFIGSSGWTGKGQTGHVVDDDINKKRSQKLEW